MSLLQGDSPELEETAEPKIDVDEDDLVEIESEVKAIEGELKKLTGQQASAIPPSKLELICEEFLQSDRSSRTLIDNFAKAMFNDARVRKICRLRGLKNGVNYNCLDDVLQRSMEVFFSRMISRLEHSNAVYAVIYSTADLVSKEIARESSELTFGHDSIEEMAENGSELDAASVSNYIVQDSDLQVDSRIAIQKLSSAFNKLQKGEVMSSTGVFAVDQNPLVGFVPPSAESLAAAEKIKAAPPADDSAPKAKRVKSKVPAEGKLHPLQQELVNICSKLGLRNQDFAVLLGIGLPRLSSYIYGRTVSVPDDVMERARSLLKEQGGAVDEMARKFDRDMSEIIADWERRLMTTSNEETAGCLGVSTMTIHRWHNDDTRPDNTALVRYENIVAMLERRLKAAEETQAKKATKQKGRAVKA